MDCALPNSDLFGLIPASVPRPIARIVEGILGLRQIASIYADLRQTRTDRALIGGLLQTLAIETRVSQKDLDHVPRKGPVLVVVNHPTGLLKW